MMFTVFPQLFTQFLLVHNQDGGKVGRYVKRAPVRKLLISPKVVCLHEVMLEVCHVNLLYKIVLY